MRKRTYLTSLVPLPLFCSVSALPGEIGLTAVGMLAGAAVAVVAMHLRGRWRLKRKDSENPGSSVMVPFCCDPSGRPSEILNDFIFWPFRNGRPVPPEEWLIDEDVDAFRSGWRDLLSGKTKESVLHYRVNRLGTLHYFEMLVRRVNDKEGFTGIIRDVTPEKAAAAGEAGFVYSNLLDSLPGCVFIKDAENGFRYVMGSKNPHLFRTSGAESIVGKADMELFPPEVAARLRKQDEEILRTGQSYYGITSFLGADDKPIYVKIYKRLHVKPDGSRLIVGIGIDVTHEYQLEHELQANIAELNEYIHDEQRMNRCLARISGPDDFGLIVNSFLKELAAGSGADRIGVFLLDEMTGVFSVSYEWRRETESFAFLPSLEAEACVRLREKLAMGKTVRVEDTGSAPAGLEVLMERYAKSGVRSVLLTGILNEAKLVGFAGIEFRGEIHRFTPQDVCTADHVCSLYLLAFDRERRLRELKESAAVRRQMIDNMPMPVILFSPDYTILMVNPSVCEAVNKKEEELVGKKCYEVLCDCGDAPDWCPMRKTLEEGKVVQMGNRIGGRDYIIHTQPIFDEKGVLLYVLEHRLDVTEQLRQSRRLSTFNLLLSNAAAAAKITYFTGTSSGEFRVIGGSTAIGLPADGIRPFRFGEWLIEEDRAPFEGLCSRILSGEDGSLEMVCRSDASGERRSYRLVVSQDRNRPEYFVGILLDITAGIALEAERQDLIKSLKNHVENERIVNAGLSQIVLEEGFDRNVDGILRLIATQFGSDRTFFGIYEEGGTKFRLSREWLNSGATSLKDVKDQHFRQLFLELYRGFRNNELLIIPDVQNSKYAEALTVSGCRTVMCAPVWAGREFCGILGVDFIRDNREISELDRTILRSAARLIEISREHQRQRESLDALDCQNRMIIGTIQVPIFLFDDKGRLIRCNPAATKLAGVSEEEMLSRPCRWSLCGASEPPPNCPVENALKTGGLYTHDMMINGHECQVTAAPIRDRSGKIVHVLESVVDMSEISESKRQLEIAMKAALAADKAKSAFLATMSHELRTPLNAVIGFSELLKADDLPPEERREYTQSINLAGNALLNLINDVLDLSKIEAEQMVIVPQPTDLRPLLDEITAVFRYKVQEKDLYFRVKCPEKLPILMLDSQRFRQILLNLVGNAVKFTSSGGITLTVEFSPIDAGSGTLQIRVLDTGIGIRQEEKERIFLPFVQQDAARDSRLFNGTGLGLAISRRLAVGMGGNLFVENSSEQGSCFILKLPKVACTDLKPENAEEPVIGPEDNVNLLPSRILLVDDVPMNLRVLQAMSAKLGFECFCAGSGPEALRIFDREKNIDIVLTDLWMPEMDGTELAGKIAKKTGGAVPVVAVTADTQIASDLPEVFAGVLLKPITPRTLRAVIRDARRKKGMDQSHSNHGGPEES